MMNSDSTYQQALLDILKRIDPQRIQQRIERPARHFMEAFQPTAMEERTYEGFLRVVVDLTLCLHSSQPEHQFQISQEDAFSKAIEWLDRFYPHHGATGSEMAMSEYLMGKAATIEQIKAAILTGYVSDARQQFIQAVLTEKIGRDWDYRYHLTRTFFKIFQQDLPLPLATAKPEDYADCLEKLLLTYAQTRHSIRQLIASTEG